MKKINVILAVSFILCSCNVFYHGNNENAHIKAKRSMKPFSHINEPIVITMPIWQRKGFLGNKDIGSIIEREGDIFVVYDWENDTIFDWAFFEGQHGLSNWRAVEMGNPLKYYDAGAASNLIGCLDPQSGKIEIYNNPIDGTFANLNNNKKQKSGYGFIQTDSYKSGYEMYNINVFNTKDNSISRNTISIAVDAGSTSMSTPDPDEFGNYWVGYAHNRKSCTAKIDPASNSVTEYVVKNTTGDNYDDIFDIRLIWKNYIFLSDSIGMPFDKMLIKDINNMDAPPLEAELPKAQDNKPACIYKGAVVNDEIYFLFHTSEIVISDLYKFDINTKKFTFIKIIDFDFTETLYTRGNRLYFISSRRLERFKCTYYDVITKEMGKIKSLTYEEICDGKK